jgi:hypothetical protein
LVEAAYGDRHHELIDIHDPSKYLVLRTDSEIWIKENLINLAEKRLLPRGWKYLCWDDTDIDHRNPDWAQETLHELQHFPVLQPWRDSIDVGPTGGVIAHRKSFGFLDWEGVDQNPRIPRGYSGHPQWGHTGYSWACTRQWWEQSGGLIDFGILGAADWYMAWAMIGKVDLAISKDSNPNFKRLLHEWQERTIRVTKKHVGYTPGRIEHHYHGTRGNRKYDTRHRVLVEHDFDPVRDLVRDPQGLYKLYNKPDLEHAIMHYNRYRSEDSIEEI